MSDQNEKDLEEYDRHPSYGMIGINRCHGHRSNLFGSPLRDHSTTMRIRLYPGMVSHRLGEDHYYADRRIIYEIELSPAQFADFVSNPNVGDGVPCTITRLDGKGVEEPPERPLETEKVRLGFEARLKDVFATTREAISEVEKLAEKAIGKRDRAALMSKLDELDRLVRDRVPYAMSSFEDSAQKVVQHAKREVDAFVQQAAHQVGVDTISQLRLAAEGVSVRPQLPEKTDGDEPTGG